MGFCSLYDKIGVYQSNNILIDFLFNDKLSFVCFIYIKITYSISSESIIFSRYKLDMI